MNRNCILIFATLILTSCYSVNNPKTEKYLQSNDSVIHIEIHSNMSPTTRNLRYFKDKKNEFIAIENNHSKSIEIFNITRGQFEKRIKPQVEGPNGLGTEMFGFDIINFDTIFITTNGYGNNLFVVDSSSRLIKKIEFEISYSPYLPIGQLWYSYGRVINYDKQKIAICNVSRTNDEAFEEIHNCSIGYCYDFANSNIFTCPLKHPDKSVLKEKILNSEGAVIVNENKTILSYPMGHYVFVSENNTDWKIYDVKSKYLKNAFSDAYANDAYTSAKKYVESSCYLALVYDKYRKVYYRFVYPGIDVSKDDDVIKLCEFRRAFSVMIIDEDFNVLGETLMPENTYNSNMFFINEAGLWISTNHPDNPDFEEDAINFRLFTLK